jgi:trigger factor
LKVSTERIPESQILMTIEVEPERLDEARKKALRKLAPRAKVPGFRPGKAPANMVLSYFGEERVLDEALDVLVPDVYREAVEADESIEPVARPRLVVETTEPLVVKATIPVRPTIELNDYASVRVTVEPIVVDESRIDETVELVRRRASTLEPIERELQWGDVLRIDLKATVEEEVLVDQQDVEIQLMEERDVLFPGFEEELLGHKKGDTVEFDLPVPENIKSEKFAGKEAHFVVTVNETKEEVLPDVDEAFLKALGEGYDSLETLRAQIRTDIERAEQEQQNNRHHEEILTQLMERATIEFPPVMLESEVDRMLHDHANRTERGEDLEHYLASIGKTEDEAREELRPVADLRLRRSLILGKAAAAEDIQVSAEEVEMEIDLMTASAGQQAAQLRGLFESENGRGTIGRNLMTRKTLARLVEIATQDAGAAPAEKAKKPRKSKKAAVASETAVGNDAASGEPQAVAAPDAEQEST